MKKKNWICLLLAFALLMGTACSNETDSTADISASTGSTAVPDTTGTAQIPTANEGTAATDSTQTQPAETEAPTDPSTGSDETEPTEKVEDMTGYWNNTTDFGIVVDENGVMRLAGEPVYTAGVNCYNLFNQCFDDFSAAEAKQTLDVLKENGISLVRFNCGGYSYDYIGLYLQDPAAYLDLLYEIVEYAQELEIGLIPSFFWLYHAVPDYYDEPLRSWGRPDSKTVQFLCSYTTAVVSTLKDNKAIFAWEFGNEFNLSCDLPNVTEHLPALPSHSTRTARTEEDYLSAEDVSYALTRFAQTIHALDDTGRMITSGNATLRPSQYHQLTENSWAQDSYEEYKQITAIFTPEGLDTVSEHVYFQSQMTFGQELSLAEYLSCVTQAAKEMKKAYFAGEWGGGSTEDMTSYREIGNDFVDAGVQICLLWNFNLYENSVEYSFSADSVRGQGLFTVLAEMNRRYKTEFNL